MSISCKKLNQGDTLSLIAPSSPIKINEFESTLKKIENLGFKHKTYSHIYDSYMDYLAGEDINRAKDFNSALKDTETKGIMCVRGGYGSLRMINHIDWDLYKNNPKVFMGFSDITPLLNYIFKKFNIITFHSPMATSDLSNEISKNSLINSITKVNETYELSNNSSSELMSFNNNITNESIGHIVGGNLSLICSTIGTEYEIPFKNNILFIEEINESPYRIDRMLTHLFLSKKINQCTGIILGDFTNCIDHAGKNCNDLLMEKLNFFNKPCIYNLHAGHGEDKITIPIGAKTKINTKDKTITILEKIVN